MGCTSPPRPRPAVVRDLADGATTWNSQHLLGGTVTCPCPTPSKVGYANREQAQAALRRLRRTARVAQRRGRRGRRFPSLPVRAYQCPCGSWHLTRKPLSREEVACSS